MKSSTDSMRSNAAAGEEAASEELWALRRQLRKVCVRDAAIRV